jgi:sulfoxide reductase heme-binding subunit YedZ
MHDALTYPPVWYLMRATGIVSLLLLTLVVALGVATERRTPLAGHRAVTHGIHRSASLLAVAFLAVHVLTAAIDPDAAVGLFALLVPFADAARPVWVGLGALSLELVAALVATSLLRRHLTQRMWKSIHWLAYAAWPLALLHGIGMGSDTGRTWMVLADIVCLAAVGAALTWRLGTGRTAAPQRQAAIVSQSLVTRPRRVAGS